MEVIMGSNNSGKSTDAVHKLISDKKLIVFVPDIDSRDNIIKLLHNVALGVSNNVIEDASSRIRVFSRQSLNTLSITLHMLKIDGFERIFIDDLDRCIESMFYPLSVSGFNCTVTKYIERRES